MMRQAWYEEGVLVRSEVVDLNAGVFTVEIPGQPDVTRDLTYEEFLLYGQVPLDGVGASAALNVVLGLWSLADASNVTGLPEDALVAEAEAWSVGMGQ